MEDVEKDADPKEGPVSPFEYLYNQFHSLASEPEKLIAAKFHNMAAMAMADLAEPGIEIEVLRSAVYRDSPAAETVIGYPDALRELEIAYMQRIVAQRVPLHSAQPSRPIWTSETTGPATGTYKYLEPGKRRRPAIRDRV